MEYLEPKRKSNVMGKLILVVSLTALCIIMLKHAPSFTSPTAVTPSSFLPESLICYAFFFLMSANISPESGS